MSILFSIYFCSDVYILYLKESLSVFVFIFISEKYWNTVKLIILIIDLNNVLWNLDSEEEFFDAPCSPLEEPLQFPTGVKSIRTRKLQKQDCSVNMTTFKIRFEVPKVGTMVKLTWLNLFAVSTIYRLRYSLIVNKHYLFHPTIFFTLIKLNLDLAVWFFLTPFFFFF